METKVTITNVTTSAGAVGNIPQGLAGLRDGVSAI